MLREDGEPALAPYEKEDSLKLWESRSRNSGELTYKKEGIFKEKRAETKEKVGREKEIQGVSP